jgi:hypothetical protein
MTTQTRRLADEIKARFAPEPLLVRALAVLTSQNASVVEIRRTIDALTLRYGDPLIADRLVSALRDNAVALTPPPVERPAAPTIETFPRKGFRKGAPPEPQPSNIRSADELIAHRVAALGPTAPTEWPK